MKKLFFAILFLPLFLCSSTYAQTITPKASSTPEVSSPTQKVAEKLSEQINNLKDRIASRVAQLNLVEKRGIVGTINEVEGTRISLINLAGDTRIVDVDEITKFFSGGSSKNTNFGISDLKKGTIVSVLGSYNKDSKRILARFIDVIILPMLVNGVISDVNRTDFTVTVVSDLNLSIIVDIENVTKTSIYTKEGDVEKAGFSKIKIGQRVHIVGYSDKKEQNRINATRILLFPELKANPKIDTSKIIPAPSDTPASSNKPTKSTKVSPTP